MRAPLPLAVLLGLGLFASGCAAEIGDPTTEDGAPPPATEGESEEGLGALPGAIRYPRSRTQSPITQDMVARWKTWAARGAGRKGDVFSKIGDSQTVNAGFMHCFSDPGVNLDGRADPLEGSSGALKLDDTIKLFLRNDGGKLTFDRESLSAKVGARSSWALGGPLTQEVDTTQARYAVVLYGGNDIMDAPTGGIFSYAKNMFAIVDTLLARGVIPILTTNVPKPVRSTDVPRFGALGADVWVPRYAAVVRGLAQARQLPLIDLERELRQIPGFGVGRDKLHLYASDLGACNFTQPALKAGVNVRNLVTLQALHRVRVAFETGKGLDVGQTLAGKGTTESPFAIDELPFSDLQTTKGQGLQSAFADYRCASPSGTLERKGGGHERVYRLTLPAARKVRASVFSREGSDVDLYVIRERDRACVGRHDRELVADLEAGSYLVVLDSEATSSEGEYLMTVVPEEPPLVP